MQYRIQVDTDTAFQAPLVDERVVDQAAYTAFDRLYPEGKLFWRVQAIDSDGNGLDLVGAAGTRDHASRTTPLEIVAPAADSQVEGTVPLRWNAQAFVGSYDVEVYKGDDPNFSDRQPGRSQANRIKTSAYVADTPLPSSGTAYRWRVRKRDSLRQPRPLDHRSLLREVDRADAAVARARARPAGQRADAGVAADGGRAPTYQVNAVVHDGPQHRVGRDRRDVVRRHRRRADGHLHVGGHRPRRDRKPIGSASSTFTVDGDITAVTPGVDRGARWHRRRRDADQHSPGLRPGRRDATYQWLRNGRTSSTPPSRRTP